ncbi:MAG: phage major capsid protein [Methanomassiliicoccales archaeon]|jgi:HK97 family phage major capsid protein
MDSKEIENIVNEMKAAAGDIRGNLAEYKAMKAKVDELANGLKELVGIKEAVALLQTKGGRPGVGQTKDGELSEHRKAFVTLVTKGKDALSPEERKSLQVSDDSKGGYAVPPEFIARVIEKQADFSPIRALAFIQTSSRGEIQIPKESGDISASWVGENESSGDSQSTYKLALESIISNKLVARVDVSNDLIEDGAVDIEGLLAARAAKKFGITEGLAFVSGTGAKQPEGILANSSVTAVAGGGASALTVDGMLSAGDGVASYYDKNAVFLMSKATRTSIRKLKDSNGVYYWQAPLTAGMPQTFNGIPIILCPDIPAVAANTYPVVYGDIREAYMIVDSKSMTVLRDELTQSDLDLVRFRFKERTGGQVVQPDAVVKVKVATSV